MKKTGLRIAQVSAVLFAVGMSAWIVVMAQQGANEGTAGTQPAGEGTAPAEAEPPFIHGSKSLAPGDLGGDGEEKPAFLPSSKSIVIEDGTGLPEKPAQDESEQDPTFLPTSKSGFVPKRVREEIERKAKEAAPSDGK